MTELRDLPPDARWAVYLAPPPAHPLARAGAAWLGREAHDAADRRPPARGGVAAPWRYGFHATLKAPMRLRGTPEAFLLDARALAARHAAFEMPALAVGALGDFLALRPAPAAAPPSLRALQALADDAVTSLDPHRQPPDAAEQARRRPERLSERERELLRRWGYPQVLDRWRCHFTLGDGGTASQASLRTAAEAHFAAALAVPWRCDALAVFFEPAPGAPLQVAERCALRA